MTKITTNIMVFYCLILSSTALAESGMHDAKNNFKNSCTIVAWSDGLTADKKAVAAKKGLVPGYIGKNISLFDIGYEYGACVSVIEALLHVYGCESPYTMPWPKNDPVKVVIKYLDDHEGSNKHLYEDIKDALFGIYKCNSMK